MCRLWSRGILTKGILHIAAIVNHHEPKRLCKQDLLLPGRLGVRARLDLSDVLEERHRRRVEPGDGSVHCCALQSYCVGGGAASTASGRHVPLNPDPLHVDLALELLEFGRELGLLPREHLYVSWGNAGTRLRTHLLLRPLRDFAELRLQPCPVLELL
jgi:hypothetical protein